MKEILDVIHKTIYQFFDVCEDDEEVPMSDKDKLLLEVNKAICNNLKTLELEPCEDAISREAVLNLLDKERDEYTIQEIKVLQSVQPKPIECDDAISREDVIKLVECSGYDLQFRTDNADTCDDVRKLPSVTQKPNMTWVTGADGAKIALKDVPVWKAIKICEILGEPQENEVTK